MYLITANKHLRYISIYPKNLCVVPKYLAVTYLDKFSTFDTVGHVKADIHFDLCVLVCKFHNGNLKAENTFHRM